MRGTLIEMIVVYVLIFTFLYTKCKTKHSGLKGSRQSSSLVSSWLLYACILIFSAVPKYFKFVLIYKMIYQLPLCKNYGFCAEFKRSNAKMSASTSADWIFTSHWPQPAATGSLYRPQPAATGYLYDPKSAATGYLCDPQSKACPYVLQTTICHTGVVGL